MSKDHWLGVISRITPAQSVDLDNLLAPHDHRVGQIGSAVFPEQTCDLPFSPLFRDPDTVCIAVQVNSDTDAASLCLRVATFALERDVEVIVISNVGYSGLERFGVRSERFVGETAEARKRCLQHIKAFWNVEVLI